MGPNADAKGRGDKVVGNGKGKGLSRAADNSPALTTCGRPSDEDTSGTGGGDNGGGDGGGLIF